MAALWIAPPTAEQLRGHMLAATFWSVAHSLEGIRNASRDRTWPRHSTRNTEALDLLDHLLFLLISAVWLATVMFGVALCRSAARGDLVRPARDAEHTTPDGGEKIFKSLNGCPFAAGVRSGQRAGSAASLAVRWKGRGDISPPPVSPRLISSTRRPGGGSRTRARRSACVTQSLQSGRDDPP